MNRWLLAVVLVSALSTPAFAAPPLNDELRALYEQAEDAAAEGDVQRARELLLQIWSRQKTYDVAANLAEIEARSDNPVGAANYARAALAVFPPSRHPDERSRLTTLLESSRAAVGIVRISAPTGASVTVDGRPVEDPAEVFVSPNDEHRVTAQDGDRVAQSVVVAEAGTTVEVQLEFPEPMGTPPEPRTKRPLAIPITAGSVALVAFGVGTGLAVQARSKGDDARALGQPLSDTACRTPNPPAECGRIQDLAEQRDRTRDAAIWSIGIGGAATAVAVTYVLWPQKRRSTRVEATPQGIRIVGRF